MQEKYHYHYFTRAQHEFLIKIVLVIKVSDKTILYEEDLRKEGLQFFSISDQPLVDFQLCLLNTLIHHHKLQHHLTWHVMLI